MGILKLIHFFMVTIILSQANSKTINLSDQDFGERKYMNLSADPCDNFYEYTCGNFEKFHPLQNNDVLIDQFTLLEDTLAEIGNEILKIPINPMIDPIALQKAKLAYIACVDHNFMDTIGMIAPESQVANRYGGFPIIRHMPSNMEAKSFGWNEIGDMAAEFGINLFFTPSLYYDTQNASRNLLRIGTDEMNIPVSFRPMESFSYDDAIEEGFLAMTKQNKIRNSLKEGRQQTLPAMEVLLRQFSLKMRRELGGDSSDEYLFDRVANISNFMKGIYAGGYIPEGTVVRPITNNPNDSVVTLRQLNEWTIEHFGDSVQIDWVEYVKKLVQYTHVDVDENFLIVNPSTLNKTLYGVLNWVRMNDEDIVKSAALLRVFVYTAFDSDSESRRYFKEYLEATGKTMYPRWKYCSRKIMDATGTLSMGLAVTYEYQLNHFNTSKLQNALSLINNLQLTFKEVINDANWMDDQSKAVAIMKANNIINLLGYPHFLTEKKQLDNFYKNLEMTVWDHYENAKRMRAFQQAYTLNMVSLRERQAWEKSPFAANAYYNRQNNRIIFPVAMLNPIFFQGSVSLLDYSRIGMIIAHEITHGFDLQGFLYNAEGVIEPWSTDQTVANFHTQTQCFVDQYSNYAIPELGANMSGSGSLNENLADNGGLRTSLRAFRKTLSTSRDEYTFSSESETYSAEQLFFIGYGTMWCSTESVSYLYSLQNYCIQSGGNCHARSQMRVNGVVSNMEEFAEAFSCPVGSKMNPEKKCKLW